MNLPTRRFEGITYRAHHPGWAYDPLSGEGAKRHGGRFSRPGLAALYTSLSLETAWFEAQQGFAFKAQPITMVAYQVDCEPVADLTEPSTHKALDIAPETLACAWADLAGRGQPVPTWDLADQLISKGIAGIIVPSFAKGAPNQSRNLVLWRWGIEAPTTVKLIDDSNRLPINQSSWPALNLRQ